jgi:hypothetical protein
VVNSTNEVIAGTEARCEKDTHADTCVAGPNFVITEYTGEHCDVTPYSNVYEPITDVPIVNASTAYTNPETGETLILRFNQVLWYGRKMAMSLINPNQIRHSGLVVSDDPTDHDRVFGITGDTFKIPVEILGTTIFFSSRAPTKRELENCRVLDMTLDSPWNPAEVYIRGVGVQVNDIECSTMREICAMSKIPSCPNGKRCDCCDSALSVHNDASMIPKMVGAVSIATAHRDPNVSFIGSKDKYSKVNAETVARRFRCGLETAEKTLKATTQRGVRHALHPLNRRYRVDHLNLNRTRLHDTF